MPTTGGNKKCLRPHNIVTLALGSGDNIYYIHTIWGIPYFSSLRYVFYRYEDGEFGKAEQVLKTVISLMKTRNTNSKNRAHCRKNLFMGLCKIADYKSVIRISTFEMADIRIYNLKKSQIFTMFYHI